MARRSDHTREELRELLVREGHALMAETGFARFSGREVAKRAGYTVGTIYNIFGSLDGLLLAINTRTFEQWTAFLEQRLAAAGADRIAALYLGRMAAEVKASEVTHAQVVELITSGRSGDLGLTNGNGVTEGKEAS